MNPRDLKPGAKLIMTNFEGRYAPRADNHVGQIGVFVKFRPGQDLPVIVLFEDGQKIYLKWSEIELLPRHQTW